MTIEEISIENALMIIRGVNGIMDEIRTSDMTEAVESLLVLNLAEAERILESVLSK